MKFKYDRKRQLFIDPLTNNEFDKNKSFLSLFGSNIELHKSKFMRGDEPFDDPYFYCEMRINNNELSIEDKNGNIIPFLSTNKFP